MRGRVHPGLVLLMFVSLAPCARAADPPQTIVGEIVDPSTYLREGRHGPELEEQTYEAVDGGQTLALLAQDTDTLYLFLAEEPGEDPNELAYDYVNRRVKATGTVYTRGGLKGLVPTTIEPMESPKSATPASPPATAEADITAPAAPASTTP